MTFHRKCGKRIVLSNNNRTASRNVHEFNHGIVLSENCLVDDKIFEIRIDKKIHSWSGSIEIGVTCLDPETIELPACATKLKNGTWIFSGISVLKDGSSSVEYYGADLDKLEEGDRVGVCRTSQGELIFYVNGDSQGVAARNIPKNVYALVNLYGKCGQVSVISGNSSESENSQTLTQNIDIPMSFELSVNSTLGSSTLPDDSLVDQNDKLRFHSRCGSLVKLSANCRTAERRRPLDEFNNGVVMTHRPLKDNELFEIRIDRLVDKWSGSIEVGVTTHCPSALQFPATMTNLRSGTIMMSGCGILTNGKGTRREYGEFNLDELREGDRVGMMRKSNGNLHYFINGRDQGVAATRVSPTLWGVIDLYGMTIKVTIVDRDEIEEQNLVTRRNNLLTVATVADPEPVIRSPEVDFTFLSDRLLFHNVCGSHAQVTHSGRTALRPNASDDFNNGVVLTRRPLKPNELFQVRLERVVTKWAGSIEMGVTTHSPLDLEFPFTMTNVRSGTWMMTGNGVMQNGTTIIEQYGQNLDRLQVGDRVGVVRKDDGSLHFFVNSVDQGVAATNVPEKVYGVIDLYGQAAQASIVDTSECNTPDTGNSTISNTTLFSSEPKLRFHQVHGRNARITNNGLTASRPKALAEFNDSIVFSNRPLKQRELFEVIIESVVDHWNGSIEIGVTGIRPDELTLPSTATDLDRDTIMISGTTLMSNGVTVRNDLPFDLDTLTVACKIGVMRNGDYIHFYINGVDQGPLHECKVQNIYAVIDLYGQCASISIISPLCCVQPIAPYATSESQSLQATSVIQPGCLMESKHRWSCISGSVTILQNWTVATRATNTALSRCLVFSERPLIVGEPFEIRINETNTFYAGSLKIGVTDLNLADEHVRKNMPVSIKRIPANCWYVSGNELRHNNLFLHRSLASLDWLRVGDRIAIEMTPARTLRILLNSEDMMINFHHVSDELFVVVELQGSTMAVQIISSQGVASPLRPCSLRLQDSLELGLDPLNKQDSMLESIDSECLSYEFSEFHGKNIQLADDKRQAMRIQSYNQSIVALSKPLFKGQSVSVKVTQINAKWQGTIGVGVIGTAVSSNFVFPTSAILMKRPCWIITHDFININGCKTSSKLGEVLTQIQVGTIITITLTISGTLTVSVGSTILEDLATGLPTHVYPVFDLYGKCEKISLHASNELKNCNSINDDTSLSILNNIEIDNSLPHCEKTDLVSEKESDQIPTAGASMSRSVMESVSENLLMNLSIKNRTANEARNQDLTNSCCLRDSLQLQHSTNLNIQRSQSTQRFTNMINSSNNCSYESNENNNQEHNNNNQENNQETFVENNSSNSNRMENNFGISNMLRNMRLPLRFNNLNNDQINNTTRNESIYSSQQQQQQQQLQQQSQPQNPTQNSEENKDCDYLKLLMGFKRTLMLPDVYFISNCLPTCFCENCHKSNVNLRRWVRFPINQQITNRNHCASLGDDWITAYCTMRVDKIRQILDVGQPFPNAEIDQVTDNSDIACTSEDDVEHVILRSYPDSSEKAIPFVHRYMSNSVFYRICTTFEVKARKQSLSLLESDSASSDSLKIWTTKEINACVLTALLLCLIPV